MYVYSISCQASDAGRERIHATVSAIGASMRVLDSQWLVKTELSAVKLAEPFRPLLGEGDAVLVIEVKDDWAAPGLPGSAIDWLADAF